LWFVQPVDDTTDKKLKKFKGNQRLVKNYKAFISELKTADDPRLLGDLKHGRFQNSFSKHLTKSHSLIYYVDFQKRTVFLIDLDDHKNLYGRDNRS
jgi:mRNA-degrading endonuclease RelE of RelBE toxin-antitoxin system